MEISSNFVDFSENLNLIYLATVLNHAFNPVLGAGWEGGVLTAYHCSFCYHYIWYRDLLASAKVEQTIGSQCHNLSSRFASESTVQLPTKQVFSSMY